MYVNFSQIDNTITLEQENKNFSGKFSSQMVRWMIMEPKQNWETNEPVIVMSSEKSEY